MNLKVLALLFISVSAIFVPSALLLLSLIFYLLFLSASFHKVRELLNLGWLWLFVLFVFLTNFLFFSFTRAVFFTLRIILIFLSLNLFYLTVSPNEFESVLRELKVPFSLIFISTTAYRFVPLIRKDFEMVRNAQRARGVSFKSRNPFAWFSLVVPLLNVWLQRAEELAISLECRGFRNN